MQRRIFCFKTYELLQNRTSTQINVSRNKKTIDRSKVPVLKDDDLEEHFIKGSGPGGQNVNKRNNSVFLKHIPTGLTVKVNETRYQEQNRRIARERLLIKLDNLINGEDSVESQRNRICEEKRIKNTEKKKKLREMKSNWKKTLSETT